FTKVIIHHFMSKDLSIPRRNKVNWHYVRDDHMFSTIKPVSRHQNTQQFDALLPIELTNEEISNSNAYKEYYVIATGAAPPKPKASARRTRSSYDTSITPLTAATHISQASGLGADEGFGSILGVPNAPTDESKEELSWNCTDDEGADNEGKDGDDDEEEGNGKEDLGLNVGGEEGHVEKDEKDELYKDVNINQGRGIQENLEVKGSHLTLTLVNPDVKVDVQIQSDCLRDEAQRENEEFLKTVDVNMGQRDAKKEMSLSQQAPQRKLLPGALAGAEDQPIVQSSQHPEWFSQQQKPSSPDRSWNKTVDTLTPELLDGPTYELMKGSCKSLVELEYPLEEVLKATTDQLDWVNPEGQQYPHNLLKTLLLIPNNQGRRVIPFEHFINTDLEYLRGRASSRKYTTFIIKTKATDYEHIKWIEDLVPRTTWIEEPIGYDKHALWGVSHWGRTRQ
nr:hypothetical protein [Tanacetum cinerariifolium]